ncbi:aldehyde dehydrogenase, partial [bacterium]
MNKTYPYWLANRAVSPEGGKTLAVTDKFSGETVTHVAVAGPDVVERALAAGYAARAAMRKVPAYQRK